MAAFAYICLLVWSLIPNELEFLAEVSRITGLFELGRGESPMAALDMSMTMILLVSVCGSWVLITITKLFAAFFLFVLRLILEKRLDGIDISDAPPPLRWLFIPLASYAISVATLQIFPTA